MQKLSAKDIRALKIGAVCAGAIVLFLLGNKWLEHWTQVRSSISVVQTKLEAIDLEKARQAGLTSVVPAFEMPEKEETQKFLFRNALNEQLKKAGIKSEPLRVLTTGKSSLGGHKLLRVQCTAKCRFTQLLDLLAKLNENPYLVGVEELRIRCDKKNQQDVQLDMTVSTLVK